MRANLIGSEYFFLYLIFFEEILFTKPFSHCNHKNDFLQKLMDQYPEEINPPLFNITVNSGK